MIAVANIYGSTIVPNLKGTVWFKDVVGGVEVCVNVSGLPPYQPARNGKQPVGPHGFHIHEFGNCSMHGPESPFQSAGEHWNPTNQPHGNHAADLPVLFSNGGIAIMCFFTNKFRVADVIGKSAIIHENPDDYRTQPAGNSGQRIGCGVIRQYS